MARLYLLDTNILIAALKGQPAVRTQLEHTPVDALRLSTVVLGELLFGAAKSRYAERNHTRLKTLTQRLIQVGVDAHTAEHYAQIRHKLEKQGTLIGANDLWIAAQARGLGAVLVTDKQREFQRVPDLESINWLTN